jgi:hypothetical protein
VSKLTEDTTLGGKQDDTSLSDTPTDNTVPETVPAETPTSETDVKTQETETEAATTDKPGSRDEAPKSRAAQRIGDLIRQNKALREQLEGSGETEETGDTTTTPEPPKTDVPTPPVGDTQEYQRAKDFLKNLGFSPTSEIKQTVKDEIQAMEARMILDSEKMRLEKEYNGSDGRPKYEHEKVLKHARESGIYNPEAAYKDLYEAELVDWAIKNSQQGGPPFVERPTSSAAPQTGQLTRESLARILSTPEGRKWYDENRLKILSALSKGEL